MRGLCRHKEVDPVSRGVQYFLRCLWCGEAAGVLAEELQILSIEPQPEVPSYARVDEAPSAQAVERGVRHYEYTLRTGVDGIRVLDDDRSEETREDLIRRPGHGGADGTNTRPAGDRRGACIRS